MLYCRAMSERGDRQSDAEAVAVDESLIDAMLALSPEGRLRQNDRMVRTILLVKQGLAARDPSRDDGER
jgi:hypothetical protein